MPDRVVGCFSCTTVHTFEDVVPRRADCERCGTPLHCCRNCGFYDATAHNGCREPSAERVVDKEASNFCDFFRAGGRAGAAAAGAPASGPTGGARGALEDLFKKS